MHRGWELIVSFAGKPTRFLLSTHYTHYDVFLFGINFTALLVVLVAKLPIMHRVRVFGIGKVDYDMD